MPSSRPIAIIGASGQLGSDLARTAVDRGLPVVALDHDAVEVTDRGSLERALRGSAALAVVNCAAFHHVDRCEEDPERALRVNALGALRVAQAARGIGARVVHVSTDYVFDGERPRGEAYAEDDPPHPLNTYGASKLAGEHLARTADPDCLVVRVAGLFGRTGARGKGGGNFVDAIAAKVRAGEPLTVVDDQYLSPTFTVDAADAILRLIERGATGTVHVANHGSCSWHELAAWIVRCLGRDVPIAAISAEASVAGARRPANTALSTDRLAGILGAPLRPWQEAVRAYLEAKATGT